MDSTLAQTYRPIEILVIDDASTDRRQSIIASYDDRVTCFHQPRNRGQFQNVNDGIATPEHTGVALRL